MTKRKTCPKCCSIMTLSDVGENHVCPHCGEVVFRDTAVTEAARKVFGDFEWLNPGSMMKGELIEEMGNTRLTSDGRLN